MFTSTLSQSTVCNVGAIIKTQSTSRNSAQGDEVVLRETSRTRLVFKPQLVNNPHNQAASVRGVFVFREKKPSGQWADYKTLDLSKLRDGEWIKLELKSEELQTLFTELNRYYDLYKQYGIRKGTNEFIVTPRNTKDVIVSFLDNPENFSKLQELKVEDLKKLTVLANLNSLKTVVRIWKEHSNDGNEEFWQKFFRQYSWIITQVFATPIVLFQDRAYVGGKTIEDRGGNIADFLFRNRFTENVLIVEIKTLQYCWVQEYRRGAYRLSSELSGSLVVILKYKHELQRHYDQLQKEDEQFKAFDPKCMVVAGHLASQLRKKNTAGSAPLHCFGTTPETYR